NRPTMVAHFTAASFRRAVAEGQVAHLCIDAQSAYIKGLTVPVVERIGRKVIPAFRAAGIPTYLIVMGPGHIDPNIKSYQAEAIIEKHAISSFTGTDLHGRLQAGNKKILLLSGFVRSVCIKFAFDHARVHGYQPILLDDCTNPVEPLFRDRRGTLENPY